MSFTSLTYFLFLIISVAVSAILPKKYKWISLLIFSAVYYALVAKLLSFWLLGAIAVTYVSGLVLGKISDSYKAARKDASKEDRKAIKKRFDKYKKTAVTIAVSLTFGMLLLLKYKNFFVGTVADIFGFDFTPFKIALPLGISYYTLGAVSYIVDVYRGKYKAELNPFRLSLFLCFFPQMTEGPIMRYDQSGQSLNNSEHFSYRRFCLALLRIVWGLFKKLVIADRANIFVSSVFDNGNQSGSVALVATLLYTIQIYCEFSGCIDIVMGSAEMLGVKLSENFSRPVFSKSINEFWQRWHITLGLWIKEYIFYPVSLSKPIIKLSKSAREHIKGYVSNLIPTTAALFFVWFFNGFWHGASWKYILYGLYYYILMTLGTFSRPLWDKLKSRLKISDSSHSFRCFQMVRTFIIVNVGMMLFRCESVGQWLSMIKSVFTSFNGSNIFNGSLLDFGMDAKDFIAIAVGMVIVFAVEFIQEYKCDDIRQSLCNMNIVLRYVLFLLLMLAVVIFGAYGEGYETVAPIYGQF